MLLLGFAILFACIPSCFTCCSGEIWTKLLLNKVKNLSAMPFLLFLMYFYAFFQRCAKKRASYETGNFKNMIIYIWLLWCTFDAGQLKNSSYSSPSKNLFDFKKLNGLFFSLEKRISTFVTYNDLAQKLAEKKAMYHKNCLSKHNQSHLPKLKSKPQKSSAIADAPQTSRRWVSANNFTKACFFCDAKNDSEALHKYQTLYLDIRVWKIAHEMLDPNCWKDCLKETWLPQKRITISLA